MNQNFSIHAVSEKLLTISFGNSIETEISKKVFQAYQQLQRNRHSSWLDIIPAYTTVSIVYDVLQVRQHQLAAFGWMRNEVEKILLEPMEEEHIPSRQLQITVCYDMEFALDANRIRKEKNISLDDLVAIHTSKSYHVFMIGFLPGFGYMGPVDQRIAAPRIPTPRTQIPAGSVGIAGEQTGIYPLDSPGGWNIIGKTPLKIFDPDKPDPVLFKPGDQVTFIPITKQEFESFNFSTFKILKG